MTPTETLPSVDSPTAAELHTRGAGPVSPVRVCIGHGQGLTLDVSGDLIAPERAVLGSEYFRFDDLADSLSVLTTHEAVISRVITHQVLAAGIADAFALFLSGVTGKVVVTQEVDS